MTQIFADTWYFLALMNPNEAGHTAAVEWSRKPLRIVTTEYIVLELGNAMSAVGWRSRFLQLVPAFVNRMQSRS